MKLLGGRNRAYKLHRGMPRSGGGAITAADAAAHFDEIARAAKRSSPSGKTVAARADRAAAEGAALPLWLLLCAPLIIQGGTL